MRGFFSFPFQALASIAHELNFGSVSLISTSHRIVETFLSEATILGITVSRILELSHHQRDMAKQVERFVGHGTENSPQVVILIVNSHEAVTIAEHLKHSPPATKPVWLIGSLGLELKKLKAWRRVFHRGIFVEPHMPELKDFENYFIETLRVSNGSISYLSSVFLAYANKGKK